MKRPLLGLTMTLGLTCAACGEDLNNLLTEFGALNDPSDSFDDRLMVLGEATASDGSRKLYLQGVADGRALSTEQLLALEIWVDGELVHGCTGDEPSEPDTDTDAGSEPAKPDAGTQASDAGVSERDAGAPIGTDAGAPSTTGDGGLTTTDAGLPLPPSDAGTAASDAGTTADPGDNDAATVENLDGVINFRTEASGCTTLPGIQLRGLAELGERVFSISIVNDYSASMTDEGIEQVADIQQRLFQLLPPVYETEVLYFGSEVETILPFSTSTSAVRSAVAADRDYDRSLTSLYDGMGTALDSIAERNLPVRLMIVSTDGLENDSEDWTKRQVLDAIPEHGVITIMLGSYFADVAEMREFTRPHGAFFYTPQLSALAASVERYLRSLANGVELQLPPELDGEDIELRVSGLRTEG